MFNIFILSMSWIVPKKNNVPAPRTCHRQTHTALQRRARVAHDTAGRGSPGLSNIFLLFKRCTCDGHFQWDGKILSNAACAARAALSRAARACASMRWAPEPRRWRARGAGRRRPPRVSDFGVFCNKKKRRVPAHRWSAL